MPATEGLDGYNLKASASQKNLYVENAEPYDPLAHHRKVSQDPSSVFTPGDTLEGVLPAGAALARRILNPAAI